MAIYKHISTYLKHDGVFEPRIPNCRHKDQEDDKIPRVSVAPTLEDCLTAIPNGGMHLDQLNMDQRGLYLLITIDTEKLGISKDSIIPSETLYKQDLVRDADITNELWITEAFQVPKEDMQIIKITNWHEAAHDVVPHSIYEIAEKNYDGDYIVAFESLYGCNTPCSVGIEHAEYFTESILEGQEISLDTDNEIEMEEVLLRIEGIKELEVTDTSFGELQIRAIENVNIRDLFEFHAEIAEL